MMIKDLQPGKYYTFDNGEIFQYVRYSRVDGYFNLGWAFKFEGKVTFVEVGESRPWREVEFKPTKKQLKQIEDLKGKLI